MDRTRSRPNRRTDAFTLAEMVVVLVLLGILAALAVPTFQSLVENSRIEGTRLAAVAVANEVDSLVVLAQGRDASVTNAHAASWADTVDDLDPTTSLWDDDTAYVGAADAPAVVTLRKDYGGRFYFCDIVVVTLTVENCRAGTSGDGASDLSVSYPPLVFSADNPGEEFAPIVAGADGPLQFVFDQVLPGGFGFDEGTGVFVAPSPWPAATSVASSDDSHMCAVSAGELVCWGGVSFAASAFGMGGFTLGDGSTTSSASPVTVAGLAGPVVASAGGYGHHCALLTSGAVQCWGLNASGQLGNGVKGAAQTAPVSVTGLSGAATAVDAGWYHSCALIAGGTVQCWGSNSDGQLGIGAATEALSATTVPGLADVTAISVGAFHTCAVTGDGAAYCWGYGLDFGRLGTGSTTTATTPTVVAGGLSFTTIAAGVNHSCALTGAGAAYCWGANNGGQLGTGDRTNTTSPVAVTGLSGVTLTGISVADGHTCATASDGTAYCWGVNAQGELGNGANGSTGGGSFDVPRAVTTTAAGFSDPAVPPLADVVSVVAGGTGASAATCAELLDGSVQCWGALPAAPDPEGTPGSYLLGVPREVARFTGLSGFPLSGTVTATPTSGSPVLVPVTLSVSP